ncbi:MAG: hypothetical protein ABIH41_06820 [Nanoarchaeota archaeon]
MNIDEWQSRVNILAKTLRASGMATSDSGAREMAASMISTESKINDDFAQRKRGLVDSLTRKPQTPIASAPIASKSALLRHEPVPQPTKKESPRSLGFLDKFGLDTSMIASTDAVPQAQPASPGLMTQLEQPRHVAESGQQIGQRIEIASYDEDIEDSQQPFDVSFDSQTIDYSLVSQEVEDILEQTKDLREISAEYLLELDAEEQLVDQMVDNEEESILDSITQVVESAELPQGWSTSDGPLHETHVEAEQSEVQAGDDDDDSDGDDDDDDSMDDSDSFIFNQSYSQPTPPPVERASPVSTSFSDRGAAHQEEQTQRRQDAQPSLLPKEEKKADLPKIDLGTVFYFGQ